MTRRKKMALFAGLMAGLIFMLAAAALLVLRSEWFEGQVRERIVAEVESRTGGRAELERFRFDIGTLGAELENFTLRGTEPAGERPLFHARRIRIGLKLIAPLRGKVNLSSLVIEKPEVNILVSAAGATNIPTPRQPGDRDPMGVLLDLAIGEFAVHEGVLIYDSKRIPLNARGEDLNATFRYDAARPQYLGRFSASRLRLAAPRVSPVIFHARAEVAILRDRLEFADARLAMDDTEIRLNGAITDLKSFEGRFDVQARLAMSELAQPLELPLGRQGNVIFTGEALLAAAGHRLTGRLSGNGLSYRAGKIDVRDIRLASDLGIEAGSVKLSDLRLNALGGSFAGSAEVREWNEFAVRGDVRGFSLEDLSRFDAVPRHAWNGSVSGPVSISGNLQGQGVPAVRARADVSITPTPGGNPMRGQVAMDFDQRSGKIDFGQSWLAASASRIEFSGRLGEVLRVSVESRNLDDLLPAIAMAGPSAPKSLPVALRNGVATFEGEVTGPLADPRLQGRAEMTGFVYEGQQVDRLRANLQASRSGAAFQDVLLVREGASVRGQAQVQLFDWKVEDRGTIAASFRVQGADLAPLLEQAGQKIPVSGTMSGALEVGGTVGTPEASANVTVSQASAYGERFDRVSAAFRYAGNVLTVASGQAAANGSRLTFEGTYHHPAGDWRNGTAVFQANATDLRLAGLHNLQQHSPGLSGRADFRATGTARVVNLQPRLTALAGQATASDLVMDGRRLGSVQVSAQSEGNLMMLRAAVDLRGTAMQGDVTIRMADDYPAEGRFYISRLDFGTLADLASAADRETELPFGGFLEGTVQFRGPVLSPEKMTGEVRLPTIRLVPRGQTILEAAERAGVTLQNNGPVQLTVDRSAVRVQQAQFVGQDTNITVSGNFAFGSRLPWDLRVNGTVNLALARSFDENVSAAGQLALNMVVRGTLDQPQVGGRVEVRNASMTHREFPSGLDEASGVILFDRNRATIGKLTARAGGGSVDITGFLGVSGSDLMFRLQAKASEVRLRYPQDMSTVFNATLNLTGGTNRSLLSGVVSVERVAFSPRTDVGGLLAASTRPITTPTTQSPFLRGMVLDVHIQTAPDAEFVTSLTQNVQAEADLRIRGTAARPSLLGRTNIHQGEIAFFGNTYTINRGDVAFYNPARIEPVLDLDLETKVRGILVTINFSGPLSKLRMTYRSDPPLQTNEIVALLAVGRAPQTATMGVQQTVSSGTFLQSGASGLLGQAIANPVSGRLQRFFGVSRLRIDPDLTGLDTIPQARLTIEQQLSKEITLTYVTNLTKTQSQLVRVQWDFSRTWSVVAIRDENGIFGVDFQYRRNF